MDTVKPTPQNMTRVLIVSTSTSVPEARASTLAIVTICGPPNFDLNNGASFAFVKRPACELAHTKGYQSSFLTCWDAFQNSPTANEHPHGKDRKSDHHREAPGARPTRLYGRGGSFSRSIGARWSQTLSTTGPKQWADLLSIAHAAPGESRGSIAWLGQCRVAAGIKISTMQKQQRCLRLSSRYPSEGLPGSFRRFQTRQTAANQTQERN